LRTFAVVAAGRGGHVQRLNHWKIERSMRGGGH
jgi:hypothetical protein